VIGVRTLSFNVTQGKEKFIRIPGSLLCPWRYSGALNYRLRFEKIMRNNQPVMVLTVN